MTALARALSSSGLTAYTSHSTPPRPRPHPAACRTCSGSSLGPRGRMELNCQGLHASSDDSRARGSRRVCARTEDMGQPDMPSATSSGRGLFKVRLRFQMWLCAAAKTTETPLSRVSSSCSSLRASVSTVRPVPSSSRLLRASCWFRIQGVCIGARFRASSCGRSRVFAHDIDQTACPVSCQTPHDGVGSSNNKTCPDVLLTAAAPKSASHIAERERAERCRVATFTGYLPLGNRTCTAKRCVSVRHG